MVLDPLDIAVLGAYLLLLTGMGLYFARKNSNTEAYFVGSRSFSGALIGLSLVGTSISSITFIAYPGDAFKTAWLRFAPNLLLPLAVGIAAIYFLPFFRGGRTTSAYEILEQRFGPSIRIYGALAFLLGQIVRISMILYLLALVLHEVTGFGLSPCIWLAGFFVAFYTIVGGIEAVVWTDVVQTLILIGGGLACYWIILSTLPNGFAQIFEVAHAHNKLSFSELQNEILQAVPWNFSVHEKTVPMLLLVGLSAWLTEYSSNQNVIQRYCASKSDREARKAMLICALMSLPIWALYMFLGTSLFVFFQVFPDTAATQMLNGTRSAEGILPFFIVHYLPPGFAGLVIAAVLAAAMSSLDSSINAISTVWVVDIDRRHLRPGLDERSSLQSAWSAAAVASLLMILGAGYLAESPGKTLQDTAMILTSLLASGMLGIYLLAFFTQRATTASVWIAIVATLGFTAWTLVSQKGILADPTALPFDLYYAGLIGNAILFTLAWVLGKGSRAANPIPVTAPKD